MLKVNHEEKFLIECLVWQATVEAENVSDIFVYEMSLKPNPNLILSNLDGVSIWWCKKKLLSLTTPIFFRIFLFVVLNNIIYKQIL